MIFIKQLSLITLFYIVGELFSFLIKQFIPDILIPGSLIGMLLLFLLLHFKIIKFKWIDSVGDFFINNMAFFFIPSVVSLLAYFDVIKPILSKLIIVLFISFCITFICVGFSAKIILKINNTKENNKDD